MQYDVTPEAIAQRRAARDRKWYRRIARSLFTDHQQGWHSAAAWSIMLGRLVINLFAPWTIIAILFVIFCAMLFWELLKASF